jgi:hypothetical protein
MTPEQERVWNYLRWNARSFAKEFGDQLLALTVNKKPYWNIKFHKLADEYFNKIMDCAPNEIEVMKVVRIWLSEYQLPLDPSKLESQDRFDKMCGPTISRLVNEGILVKEITI